MRLDNLPAPSLTVMVAEMLHVDPAAAAGLVEAIEPHTHGNPYETVELLNALHRDGVLTATAAGWRWHEAAVRARLGQSDVAELLAARAQGLPPASRQIVERYGVPGRASRAERVAGRHRRAGRRGRNSAWRPPSRKVCWWRSPACVRPCGLATTGSARRILRGLDPQRRSTLQLAMARRLAGVPELFAVAAEQYLPVVDALRDAAERRVVVGLLRRAAEQAALIGDHARVNALLAAALRLIDPADTATLVEVHTGRHAALFGLGRLDEADEEYRAIERLSTTALERADATAVQVRSLTHRNRSADAMESACGAARSGYHRPGGGPASRRARPPVRPSVPVVGPQRRRG